MTQKIVITPQTLLKMGDMLRSAGIPLTPESYCKVMDALGMDPLPKEFLSSLDQEFFKRLDGAVVSVPSAKVQSKPVESIKVVPVEESVDMSDLFDL